MRRDNGFTLAEVLVTLGIIGIVAAMTLPSVIRTYIRIVLENRFKKTSAILEAALQSTMIEFGTEYLLTKETNRKYVKNRISDIERKNINDYFATRLKVGHHLKLKHANEGADTISHEANLKKVYAYKSGNIVAVLYLYNAFHSNAYLLPDGSVISDINFQTHGVYDGMKVTIDTNGPFKGPNRYGYDIFIYDSGGWNADKCGSGDREYDHYGCYKYAAGDRAPDDKSKGYWKSLDI